MTGSLDPARLLETTPGAAAVLPGFIDVQINGAFGHDFTSDPASIWSVGERLCQLGVTAFAPTIISCGAAERTAAYDVMRNRPDDYGGAEPLGLHLEGPLLAVERHGAHSPAMIERGVARRESVVAEVIANADVVALVTLAPELPGALDAIAALTAAGVAVSLGHSNADEGQARAGFDAGATAVTHLFNAMAPLHHRDVGLVGAALADSRVFVGLIADNHHVSPTAIKLVWDLVGPDRLMLVTDAMAAMGAAPGRYAIGGRFVECRPEPRTPEGHLAGSVLDLPTAAANSCSAVKMSSGLPSGGDETAEPGHVLAMARILAGNQARFLSLDVDTSPADAVVVDARYRPLATFVAGQCRWRHPDTHDRT